MRQIANGYSSAMTDELFRSMFEDRKQVFVDLLKWDVPVLDDRYEIDQFDNENATYVVIPGPDGRHVGSARLLATDGAHILGSIFPDLCEAPPPSGPDIWEITRFCLSRRLCARERHLIRDQLVSALVDYALEHRISQYTGVAEWPWFQQILSFGWECRPLGLPAAQAGADLVAMAIDIDAHTPAKMAAAGVYRSVALRDLAAAA